MQNHHFLKKKRHGEKTLHFLTLKTIKCNCSSQDLQRVGVFSLLCLVVPEKIPLNNGSSRKSKLWNLLGSGVCMETNQNPVQFHLDLLDTEYGGHLKEWPSWRRAVKPRFFWRMLPPRPPPPHCWLNSHDLNKRTKKGDCFCHKSKTKLQVLLFCWVASLSPTGWYQ